MGWLEVAYGKQEDSYAWKTGMKTSENDASGRRLGRSFLQR